MENKKYEILDLDWDTNFFKINCGKVIINDSLEKEEFLKLLLEIDKYDFVSINNLNSNVNNSKIIGQYSKAFLIDLNIQFNKKVSKVNDASKNILIKNDLPCAEEIFNLLEFKNSRFINDINLLNRNGNKVYYEWVKNSFNKNNKYFVISKNEKNKINGFILFSIMEKICTIELIAVLPNQKGTGIGTKLISNLERYLFINKKASEIFVGTQVNNIQAINFYNLNGFKYYSNNQVYHLWK